MLNACPMLNVVLQTSVYNIRDAIIFMFVYVENVQVSQMFGNMIWIKSSRVNSVSCLPSTYSINILTYN